MANSTSPQIKLVGHYPDRLGWVIMLDGVPMASSKRNNMTPEEAKKAAEVALEKMMTGGIK